MPTSCQKGPNLKPTSPKIVQLVAKIAQNRSPSSSRPPPNLQKSSKSDGGSFVFTLSRILGKSRPRYPKCSKMLPKMVPSWLSEAPSRPTYRHLDAILVHLGTKMAPRGRPNDVPEAAQTASRATLAPRRVQNSPKTSSGIKFP